MTKKGRPELRSQRDAAIPPESAGEKGHYIRVGKKKVHLKSGTRSKKEGKNILGNEFGRKLIKVT